MVSVARSVTYTLIVITVGLLLVSAAPPAHAADVEISVDSAPAIDEASTGAGRVLKMTEEISAQAASDSAEGKVDLAPLSRYFGVGLIASVFLVLWMAVRILCFSSVRTWTVKGYPVRRPSLPSERTLRFLEELPYLSTDWSFKESWFTDVTVGVGALTGLLGTAGTLETIAGSDDAIGEAAARIAVAGAVSLVFGAVGPLFLKVIGNDSTKPNVLGLLCAAFFTFIGAIGEVAALTMEASRLAPDHSQWIDALGWFVGVVAFWTAATLLWRNILLGSTKPDPELSEEEKAALIIVKMQKPASVPREKAELLVMENQAETILKAATKLDGGPQQEEGQKEEQEEVCLRRKAWLQTPYAHYAPLARRRSPLI